MCFDVMLGTTLLFVFILYSIMTLIDESHLSFCQSPCTSQAAAVLFLTTHTRSSYQSGSLRWRCPGAAWQVLVSILRRRNVIFFMRANALKTTRD